MKTIKILVMVGLALFAFTPAQAHDRDSNWPYGIMRKAQSVGIATNGRPEGDQPLAPAVRAEVAGMAYQGYEAAVRDIRKEFAHLRQPVEVKITEREIVPSRRVTTEKSWEARDWMTVSPLITQLGWMIIGTLIALTVIIGIIYLMARNGRRAAQETSSNQGPRYLTAPPVCPQCGLTPCDPSRHAGRAPEPPKPTPTPPKKEGETSEETNKRFGALERKYEELKLKAEGLEGGASKAATKAEVKAVQTAVEGQIGALKSRLGDPSQPDSIEGLRKRTTTIEGEAKATREIVDSHEAFFEAAIEPFDQIGRNIQSFKEDQERRKRALEALTNPGTVGT